MAPLTVEIDPALMERTQRAARERGVAVPELVREALEHELGPSAEGEEPEARERRTALEELFAAMDAGGFDGDLEAIDRLNAPPTSA